MHNQSLHSPVDRPVTFPFLRVFVPSYQIRVLETIGVTEKAKKTVYFQDLEKTIEKYDAPEWLSLKKKELEGKVLQLPTSELMPHTIELQSIIEFYSR